MMTIIEHLSPFTKYAVHVQAVVLSQNGQLLLGEIDLEIIVRTLSSAGEFTETPSTIGPPTRNQVQYAITDPRVIKTGRVM